MSIANLLVPAPDPALAPVRVNRICNSGSTVQPDLLAVEEPLEVRLGHAVDGRRVHTSVSVTMRTPGHDEDLAVGFLFTEGIIRSDADVQQVVARGQRAADGLINVVR